MTIIAEKEKLIIRVIAFIELSLGIVTGFGMVSASVLSVSQKPPNVFMFVFFSASVSTLIGLGMLTGREWARRLLVFFSGYVLLTKVLLFFNLLELKGEMVSAIAPRIRDSASFIYHATVMILMETKRFKDKFNSHA